MDKKQTIFENALFCFASFLCAVDHMNHVDAIEPDDEERRMPTSFDLMKLKNGDKLFNSRYDILVKKFLFQLGIRISYLKSLGEEMYLDCDPSTWDMYVLLYKLMREIWMETTDGDPIGKMNKFTSFIMNAVNRCAHTRTLHAIIIFLLPHRVIDVSQMTSIGPGTVYLMVGEKKAPIFSMCGGVIRASSLWGLLPEVWKVMHHLEASEGSGLRLFRRGSMEN